MKRVILILIIIMPSLAYSQYIGKSIQDIRHGLVENIMNDYELEMCKDSVFIESDKIKLYSDSIEFVNSGNYELHFKKVFIGYYYHTKPTYEGFKEWLKSKPKRNNYIIYD